ncbi:MAG: NAD(+) diphosphatase [Proteobacteria bacterium]|nr:NAD(+) diphosphatase [Pseudomonadota bacterium]
MLHTPSGFVSAPIALAPPAGDALVFAFAGAKLVVGVRDGRPHVPTLAQALAAGIDGPRHYLGRLAGADCVAVTLGDAAAEPPGYRLAGLRSLFGEMPEAALAVAARAFQVVDWDRSHAFCGRCGTPTRERPGERAKECPACGLVAYPRVSPAMMVLVIRDGDVLLARANRFRNMMYSALAGFVEPGETIEDCVHREVHEEVGIEVDRLEYFASQSWAFPHSLMIAYTAHYAGGALRPDGSEIADARWFSPDALPELPSPMSIARQLIDDTVARLRGASRGQQGAASPALE